MIPEKLILPEDAISFKDAEEMLRERNRKPMDIYCYMPIRCSIKQSVRESIGFPSMEDLKVHVSQELLPYMREPLFLLDALDPDSNYISHKESLFGCGLLVISTVGNKPLESPIRLGYWTICTDKDFNEETRELKKYKKPYYNYIAKNRMEFLVSKLTYAMVHDFVASNYQNKMSDIEKGIYNIWGGNYSLDK